jgi:hypothetical protein
VISGSVRLVLAAGLALLFATSVEVRIEDTRGVSSDEARTIADGLRAAIAARSGGPVEIESKSPCGQTEACIGELEKSGATDFVFVRLIGVPTRIRLIAERAGGRAERSEVDLTRARGSWPVVLGGVAEHLFPEPMVAPPPPPPAVIASPPPPGIAVPPPAPPEEAASYAPWLLAGAGAVVLAVGVGFGASSRGARNAAANEPHTPEEIADLEDRAIGHGIAANVMFGVGGAGLLGALIWWLVD